MTAYPAETHTEAFTEIIYRFIQHNSRVQAQLPEELKQAKAKLDATQPNGKADRMDFIMITNLSIIIGQRSEPISMGELSREINAPLSTTTRIVDWLVNNGYGERLHDPNDRRVVRVGLTPAGQGVYRARSEFIKRRVAEWLKPLSEDERVTLIRLMQKLVDNLETIN